MTREEIARDLFNILEHGEFLEDESFLIQAEYEYKPEFIRLAKYVERLLLEARIDESEYWNNYGESAPRLKKLRAKLDKLKEE